MWRTLFITLFSLVICACAHYQMTPAHLNVALITAYYYEKTSQRTLADSAYHAMLQQAPHSGAAHNNYGTFLCRAGAYKRGIHELLLAANNPHYLRRNTAYRNALLCKKKVALAHLAIKRPISYSSSHSLE